MSDSDPRLIDPGPSRAGWHRLQTALQCPRKYALHMAQKADPHPVTAAPLIKGILLHTGLAHRYAFLKDPEADLWLEHEAPFKLADAQPNPADWHDHMAVVQRALVQYDLYWDGRDPWEVMEVEKELVAHIQDEARNQIYLYTQRADLIVRHKETGKVYIVDHKSTSRLVSRTLRRYTLSGQFRGYQMFGRGLLGEQFGGVILNMIQWPDKSGIAKFERHELEPAPHADRTFKYTILHAERVIRDLDSSVPPIMQPGAHHETACWTPYGACPHHDTCKWGHNE